MAANYVLTEDQQKLAESNMRLVPYTLQRYLGVDCTEKEDLVSIGYIGLCKAAATYIQGKTKFSTYAVKCIRHEVISEWVKANRPRRKPPAPLVPLNAPYNAYSDDCDEEILDYVSDAKVDVEKQVLNKIMYDKAAQYTPTFVKMIQYDCLPATLAKIEHKSKQAVSMKLQRELIIARKALAPDIRSWEKDVEVSDEYAS